MEPQRVGAQTKWGPEGGAQMGGAQKGGGPDLEKVGPGKGGATKSRAEGWSRRVGPPKGGGPKFRAFSSLSPPPFSLFLCLSGGLLVEFWWCLDAHVP